MECSGFQLEVTGPQEYASKDTTRLRRWDWHCCTAQGAAVSPGNVDGTRIINADQEPGNWMSHGRTYSEQRFGVVLKGLSKEFGIVSFDELSHGDAAAIRAYVISRANQSLAEQKSNHN